MNQENLLGALVLFLESQGLSLRHNRIPKIAIELPNDHCSIGHRPLWVRCPKEEVDFRSKAFVSVLRKPPERPKNPKARLILSIEKYGSTPNLGGKFFSEVNFGQFDRFFKPLGHPLTALRASLKRKSTGRFYVPFINQMKHQISGKIGKKMRVFVFGLFLPSLGHPPRAPRTPLHLKS